MQHLVVMVLLFAAFVTADENAILEYPLELQPFRYSMTLNRRYQNLEKSQKDPCRSIRKHCDRKQHYYHLPLSSSGTGFSTQAFVSVVAQNITLIEDLECSCIHCILQCNTSTFLNPEHLKYSCLSNYK